MDERVYALTFTAFGFAGAAALACGRLDYTIFLWGAAIITSLAVLCEESD